MDAAFTSHQLPLRILIRVACLCYDETGQDMVEYALVAALIGLGAVAMIRSVGSRVGSALNSIGGAFNDIGSTLSTDT